MALAVALSSLLARPAGAQTARSGTGESERDRLFASFVDGLAHALRDGHASFFRLVQNLELLRFESEIDRFVGDPRGLNDSTTYKLGLLPFHIEFPIYRPLIDQMTRLDTVRSRPIHMVTPDSVALTDLRIVPVLSLAAFQGEGAGDEVQRSLTTHFSGREMADLSVFLLSQQSFFPETDDGWQRVKHRAARMAVPLTLAALATGAAFDAGALSHSGKIVGRREDLRLRWYAGFRDLGAHWHPELRAGLSLRALGFQAAAGVADRIRPSQTQPDRALEIALRESWLSQLAQPLGLDTFLEVALRQSLQVPAGFTGSHTTTRAGIFFKREHLPPLPGLILRGSAELEAGLSERYHPVAALGFEHARTGLTTVVQASRISAPPGSGAATDDRVNLFVAGTMEPLSAQYTEDMKNLARQCQEQWEILVAFDRRRAAWERSLVIQGTAHRQPSELVATLKEMERILVERNEYEVRMASTLADYLESRRRAYGILGWRGAPDELHGPLPAAVLVAVRDDVLARLRTVSTELDDAVAPFAELRERIAAASRELARLEALEPNGPTLPERRRAVAELEQQWEGETERVRRQLATREELWVAGKRMLRALRSRDRTIREWEAMGLAARRRLGWLTATAAR